MKRARAVALLILLAGSSLAGCAKGSTAITVTPLCPSGRDGAGKGVILMAQSVPTATKVPCVRNSLPSGWSFGRLAAENGHSTFWLDSDRDGPQAIEVRLEQSCDTRGATEVPSDRVDMVRLEHVDRVTPSYAGSRYYLFAGGCLTFTFHLAGDTPGEGLALAAQSVGAVSRTDLQAQVRRESGGRLSLDPPPEGREN